MARRWTWQDALLLGWRRGLSSLKQLISLIDWTPMEALLSNINAAAKGEVARPPVVLFRAMLIAV